MANSEDNPPYGLTPAQADQVDPWNRMGTRSREQQADQLLREALSLFLDPESIIDLRDWVRSAQQHLGVDRAGSRLFD